jgi:hypothetical protein
MEDKEIQLTSTNKLNNTMMNISIHVNLDEELRPLLPICCLSSPKGASTVAVP